MGTSTSYISERPALANRFSIIDALGDGASSTVYLVSDSQRNGEHVALKVLQNSEAFDEHTMERFVSEMEICKELTHENIVQAYDLIDLGDTIAFTMEYVRGADLLDVFRRANSMSNDDIDRVFISILDALSVLHSRDIVHRDLKLENILIREDGAVKLSDLGLMKRLDKEGLTKPGLLLGTVHYMPPEYITGGEYDARGDLYGVAIMLLELVTRKRRLARLEGREVIKELIKTRFEIPEQLLLELPRKYRTIIRRGTAVNKNERYQSAKDMIADFERDFSDYMGTEVEMRGTIDFDSSAAREGTRIRRKKHNKLMKRVGLATVLFLAFITVVVLILN